MIKKPKYLHGIHHTNEICFARLRNDWEGTNKKGFVISGFFEKDTKMSEEQMRRYLMLCKEFGYVNWNFGYERYIKTREYIWNLRNVNLTQWYFWLTMVRYIYEHDHIPRVILDLCDKGFMFPIAVAIAHLEVNHNSGHGLYNKSTWVSGWGENKGWNGMDFWGGWEEKRILRNRWNANQNEVVNVYLRTGKKVDPNMIIKVAIQTRRFLDQKRDPCHSTGIYKPYGLHKAIHEQPVLKEEYDYGFDYGDYESLINLNPYERMKL
jgi:hypothetical protein